MQSQRHKFCAYNFTPQSETEMRRLRECRSGSCVVQVTKHQTQTWNSMINKQFAILDDGKRLLAKFKAPHKLTRFR